MGSPRSRHRYAAWAGLAAAAGAALVVARQAERSLLASWEREPRTRRATPRGFVPPPRHRRVRTDDGADLRILEWGEGPPIVLVHGITASSEDWLAVVPELLPGHRVVAVDQRGHGQSTLGAQPCDTRRLAADLAHVLGALDLHDAVLVGHSLGGYVALALAAHHPDLVADRVSALVLLGSPHTGRGVRELATLAAVAAPWTPRLQRSEVHGAVVTGLVLFGVRPDRRDVDDVRLRWARCDRPTRRCFARHLAGEHITPLLGRIQVPLVVARGTRDHLVAARRAATIARAVPGARLETFDGAGHALLPEQPAAVAAVILSAARAPG